MYVIMSIMGSQYASRAACRLRPVIEVKIGNQSKEVIKCEFAEVKLMMPMQIKIGFRVGLTIDIHENARAADARKTTAAIPEIFSERCPLEFNEAKFL